MNEPQDDILGRFFQQFREVLLGDRVAIDIDAEEIEHMLLDDVLRVRFANRFRRDAQSPDLKAIMLLYLKGLAGKEDDIAAELKIDADGIDTYLGRPGIAATGAGIAAVIATGGVGAVILFVGGVTAMGYAGFSSNKSRKRALRREGVARRLRGLLEELDGDA